MLLCFTNGCDSNFSTDASASLAPESDPDCGLLILISGMFMHKLCFCFYCALMRQHNTPLCCRSRSLDGQLGSFCPLMFLIVFSRRSGAFSTLAVVSLPLFSSVIVHHLSLWCFRLPSLGRLRILSFSVTPHCRLHHRPCSTVCRVARWAGFHRVPLQPALRIIRVEANKVQSLLAPSKFQTCPFGLVITSLLPSHLACDTRAAAEVQMIVSHTR